MHILAISGSLRTASSNTAVLDAAAMLAPPGVAITLYDALGELPHFNPDHDTDHPPAIVEALRRRVATSDALIVSSPEYAHGIAGVMKNALDWLVRSVEFPGKPVAVFNASPRATHADAQLREILATMSARLVGSRSTELPLLGRGLDAAAIVADVDLSTRIRTALDDLVAGVRGSYPQRPRC